MTTPGNPCGILPHPPPTATPSRSEGVAGTRTSCAVGEVPEYDPARPPPDLRPTREPREVARVRRLLGALRPWGPGVDTDPQTVPAEGPGASLAPSGPPRAPWDRDPPLRALLAPPRAVTQGVADRIARVPELRTRLVLEHLRAYGHLGAGYGALATAVALRMAPDERRASWARSPDGPDRARVWGGLRLQEACDAWAALDTRW